MSEEVKEELELPSDAIEEVEDPESGLTIRWTDNGPKEDDPEQLLPNSNEPLELDEHGIPFVLGGE